ncbi:unnamed protein product [Moneuplotes crassus]|uniref:Uncharacterized protein n=1 Tax=Euplotes crassus TaxID=5936 RepID=A0AAD1XHE0_EUPCR|nr:unnamed protein product [Moneuplotes crassus]
MPDQPLKAKQEPSSDLTTSRGLVYNSEILFEGSHFNTIKNDSEEKGIRLEQDFSDDLVDKSDSVTIGEIDSPLFESGENACIMLGEGQDHESASSGPSGSLEILYKNCNIPSEIRGFKSQFVTKDRRSSFDKSEDATHCCDNFKVPISSNQKVAKRSKTLGTPNADWNYFSLRRACFRGMSAYYKDKFNAFVKNNGFTRSLKTEMDAIVSNFIRDEFHNTETGNCDITTSEFLDCMITVLHSHRHKKNEKYIMTRDFTKIRQVLYSFSTAAKKTFLASPDYALVLNHFYNKEGELFLEKKSQLKPQRFRTELEVELNALNKGAFQTLSL